jgi:hypothetical protein
LDAAERREGDGDGERDDKAEDKERATSAEGTPMGASSDGWGNESEMELEADEKLSSSAICVNTYARQERENNGKQAVKNFIITKESVKTNGSATELDCPRFISFPLPSNHVR